MSVTKDFLAAVQKVPAIQGSLLSSGVIKIRDAGGDPSLTMGWGVVDQNIASFFTEQPVDSLTELVELGMTATRLGHDILGLPKNDLTLQAGLDGSPSISSLFGLVIKSRLGSGTDGNVQKLCNSALSQWLIAQKIDGQTLYATTRNQAMVESAFTGPRMLRQVSAKIKETVTAMTVAHRIPETAAQFVAALDVQNEANELARRATVAQLTEGKDPAEIRAFETEVSETLTKYRTATAEKFKAITESGPVVSKPKPKGKAADAA